MFDVAIAGAGPAGATLARLIGKSYRVLLIDKRHFQEPSEGFACEKCCGGLLAPDAQRMLSKLALRRAIMQSGLQSVTMYAPPQHGDF